MIENTPLPIALMRPVTKFGIPIMILYLEIAIAMMMFMFFSNPLWPLGLTIVMHTALLVAYKIDEDIFSVLASSLKIVKAGNRHIWKADSYGPW